MPVTSPRRISAAPATFLAVMMLTTFSWWAAETRDPATAPGWARESVTAFVMAVAAVKLHLIAMQFMELRHAPPVLRVLVDTWIVAVCGAIIGIQIVAGH